MQDESSRSIGPQASSVDSNRTDRGPAMAGEGRHLTADFIAEQLRAAGLKCEVLNPVSTDTTALRRDRIVTVLALTLLAALAWSYLLWLSADMDMGGMDMTGLRTIPSGTGLMMPAHMPWRAMDFAFVFAMWAVMMIGMMTPSEAPMLLMYARVARLTEAQGSPLTATVWFAAGYFLVWLAFSAIATLVQWALERAALLDSTMAMTSNVYGGFLFVAA